MMDVELKAELRSEVGKGGSRRVRRHDKVPAILYGPKTDPVPLSVSAVRLEKLLHEMGEESKLLTLVVEDGQKQQVKKVLLREVQIHPVHRRFLHVDLYEVPLDQPIAVEVPVELVGESEGVKRGGILNLIRRTLAVRCLPGEIPEKVEIDITSLEVGSTVHVGDLTSQVPFELLDDKDFTVVTINPPEEEVEAEVEEAEEVEESEVSQKGEEVTEE